jgi:polyisoprenyl-teichoic acid--peptidoglycan teichoic acid transferase
MDGIGRKVLAATLALTAWVSGTLVGSLGASRPATGAPILQLGRAHAAFEPALDGSEPIFILVLGTDARPGTAVEQGLADSIHVLGINPAVQKATLLGFPRDSYVPLSTGGTNRINSPMPEGGPEAMIETVEALTGIELDYYAVTDFEGFVRLVDDIGGLVVDLPSPVVGHDQNFAAGVQRVDGSAALQIARTRKSIANGDFGRSANQGLLMISALAQFRSEFGKDASRMFAWLGAGLPNVEMTLSIDELTNLAFTAMTISPKGVTNLVVPGTVETVDGMSVVTLSSSATDLYVDLEADGYISKKVAGTS